MISYGVTLRAFRVGYALGYKDNWHFRKNDEISVISVSCQHHHEATQSVHTRKWFNSRLTHPNSMAEGEQDCSVAMLVARAASGSPGRRSQKSAMH